MHLFSFMEFVTYVNHTFLSKCILYEWLHCKIRLFNNELLYQNGLKVEKKDCTRIGCGLERLKTLPLPFNLNSKPLKFYPMAHMKVMSSPIFVD